MKTQRSLELDRVVPWGRTLDEYMSMFSLTQTELRASILGCGDGPASFNSEMSSLGHQVTSIDPIYKFSGDEIKSRVQETYPIIISQLKQTAHQYVWNTFKDEDELGQARLAAMEKFLLDYEAGKKEKRYQYQSLPTLSFDKKEFELCLCSHLLFLYSEQLSLDFHIASILELLRVSREVRIFPLLTLSGQMSPHLNQVSTELKNRGYSYEIKPVEYEFQKGGNKMLTITN